MRLRRWTILIGAAVVSFVMAMTVVPWLGDWAFMLTIPLALLIGLVAGHMLVFARKGSDY